MQGQRRRKHRRNYTLYYIMLAVLLTVTGVTLSLTVFFKVETIQVTGTALYSEQQVLDVLDARPGDNLLRLNLSRLERDVRQRLVQTEEVSVKRRFPNTLEVEITDAVVTRQILSGGYSYRISSGGRVVAVEPETAANIQIVLGPDLSLLQAGDELEQLRQKEQEKIAASSSDTVGGALEEGPQSKLLTALNTLSNEIEKSGLTDISALDVRDVVNLKIFYQNRFEIRLGTFSDLQDKLAMFRSVLERGSLGLEAEGVLDVSDPDRCIASQDRPGLPDGAAQAGWVWNGPHLENFDEFFGFSSGGSASGEPVSGEDGGEDLSGDGEDGASDGAASEPDAASSDSSAEEPSTAPEPESGASSEPASSSGGYQMPQLPQVGGSSGTSHEPAEPDSSAEPAASASGPDAASEDSDGAGSGDASESQPGFVLPSLPQVSSG
ncbi:MAG: FtsQ-type POTRA domain-containing protein [Oscillospiraceae bacterium]|nr:FtsQ-type POTRA domain-containing protein [Oscillospiraceae bacterium]